MKYDNPGISGGAGPTSPSARRIAIFVGNALNGDTVLNSDYLDPGDGTGIALALAYAAANPTNKYNIIMAAGTFTRTAASPLLTVGANVSLVGSGQGITTIVGTAISGVSPQILACAAGSKYRDFSMVSPTNVAGQSASAANGIVGVGLACKFYRVDLTINVSASVVRLSPFGFVYFSATSGGGTEWHDCQCIYVGDNATGLPSGATCFFVSSSGVITPSALPIKFINCTAKADGGGSGSSFGITGFTTDHFVQHVNTTTIKLDGASVACSGTMNTPNVVTGPSIDGLTVDSVGVAASRIINGVNVSCLGTGTYRNTRIHGVRYRADANANASSRAVFVQTNLSAVLQNLSIEAQSSHPTAGSGGIDLTAGSTSAWSATSVRAQLGTGDLTFLSTGSHTNTSLALQSVRNVNLLATSVSTRIANTLGSGTLTIPAGATNTDIDRSSSFAAVTDSTTGAQGTAYGKGKTRTITGNDTMVIADDTILCNLAAGAALTFPNAALAKGKVFTVRDIGGNFAANNLTLTPVTGTINGGATLVLATSGATTRFMSDGTNWFTLGLSTAG